jgi:PPOX class probable F420-dependent enzyme
MGVRLDETEVQDFLGSAHTGILTTLRSDGSPATVPMWFVVLDGEPCVRTLARSPKAGNMRRDRRVCVLVEAGLAWSELKAVVIHGDAVFVEDPAEQAVVDALFDAKYEGYRTPDSVPEATRRHYAAPRVHVRIHPTGRLLTWDNAKLHAGAARVERLNP